jgi:hypothetical protein
MSNKDKDTNDTNVDTDVDLLVGGGSPSSLLPPVSSSSKYKKIAESAEYQAMLKTIKTPVDLKDIITLKNFAMMIVSKRRTGKSVFMKDMLSKIYKNYTNGYVFSKTISLQPEMYDFVHDSNKIKGYDEERLKKIYNEQEAYIMRMMSIKPKNMDEADYKKTLDHIMIVFDDIISDDGVRNSKFFIDLFILGRHVNIAVLVISQSYSSKAGIAAVSRKNLDYVVSFFLDTAADKDHLIEDFMSKNDRKEGLQLYTDITTVPYQCIILSNSVNSTNYNEYVFKYIANLKPREFKFNYAKPETSTGISAPVRGGLDINFLGHMGRARINYMHNNV